MSGFKFIIQDLENFNIRIDLEDLILQWIKAGKITPEDAYSLNQYGKFLLSERKKGESEA